MAFIQSFEFATDQRDEILDVMGRWSADAIGNGTAQRDRDFGDLSRLRLRDRRDSLRVSVRGNGEMASWVQFGARPMR